MKPILDISEWQTGIDYAAVAKQISGVIIRCGGTGYGAAHSVYDDARWEEHYRGFHAQGVPIGAYFYGGAVTDAGVDAEVRLVETMLKGHEIMLPAYYDIEVPQGNYLDLSVSERTRLAYRWCEGIKKAGYKPGIYTYLSYVSRLDMTVFDDMPVWMAQYHSRLEYTGHCELWQYTSSGQIDGYSGNLDLSKVMDADWFNSLAGGAAGDPDAEPEDPAEVEGFEVELYELKNGDTGNLVKSMQGILEANGRDLSPFGGCDGIFGHGTEAAVMAYQAENLLTVDGIVGPQTWGEMLKR